MGSELCIRDRAGPAGGRSAAHADARAGRLMGAGSPALVPLAEPELPPLPERPVPAPIGDLQSDESRARAVGMIEDIVVALATLARHQLGRNALALTFHLAPPLAKVTLGGYAPIVTTACMAAFESLTELEPGHHELAASSEVAAALASAMGRASGIEQQAHAIGAMRNLAAHSDESALSLCTSPFLLCALMHLAASETQAIGAAAVATFASLLRVPLNTGLVLEACGRSIVKALVAGARNDSARVRRDAVYSVSRLLGGGGDEADREPLEVQHGRSQPHLSSILAAPDVHARKAVYNALKKLAAEAHVSNEDGIVESVTEAYSELAMLHPVELQMLARDAQRRADAQRAESGVALDDSETVQRERARIAADLATALDAGLGGSADGGGGINTVALGSSLQPPSRAERLAEGRSADERATTSRSATTDRAQVNELVVYTAPTKESIAQAHAQMIRRTLTREIAQLIGRGASNRAGSGPIATLLKSLSSEDDFMRVRAPHAHATRAHRAPAAPAVSYTHLTLPTKRIV